jgi:cytoskeleton protein RodZ
MSESLPAQDTAATPVPPVSGPGQDLAMARQAQQLTVAKVAQQLHLDPRQVAALEHDDYDHLPEPIYVSGYLRKYARLLGLSEEAVVAAYQRLDRPAPPILSELTRKTARPRPPNQALIQWGAVALVGAGLVVLGWQMSGRQAPPLTAGGDDTASAPEVSPRQPPPAASRPTSDAPLTAAVDPVSPVTRSGPGPADTGSGLPPPPAGVPPPVAQTSAAPVSTMTLHFTDESWVEVTDASGQRIFYDLGEAGETRTAQGTPPFKVLLGYSPGVSIEYNGSPFDKSRFTGRNNVARFTIRH